jgi:hypothetical protein
VVAGAEHIATWPNSLLPLGIGVSETGDGLQVSFALLVLRTFRPCAQSVAVQVLNIIQGSPASQLMGVGESGQRAPLIELGDIIVKVFTPTLPISCSSITFCSGEFLVRAHASAGRHHIPRPFDPFDSQAQRPYPVSHR